MTKSLRLLLVGITTALLLVLAGCDTAQTDTNATNAKSNTQTTAKASAGSESTMSKMTIYVPLDNGKGVTPKLITVDSNKKTMAYAVSFILDEDSRQDYPIFPKGTKVNGVNLKGDTAIIDLSKEFLSDSNLDGLSAQLRLASLVNTVTEFNGVKKVQFLVNGKKVDSYGGYDLSVPMERMDKLIVK